jgi:signal transduction histidine kinase/DNA-binding LacI/PurR family transcriptional regulator/DNA-binding response OmpR family regulator
MPNHFVRERPTIGVLAGWQMYHRANPDRFLSSIFRGICAAAQHHACNVLLACGLRPSGNSGEARPAWPVPSSPDPNFAPVGPWNTDGLIIIGPLISEARATYIHDLAAAGHPIVSIGMSEGGKSAVGIDNEGGIRQAMAHLVEHGHRRIAFIAGQVQDSGGDSESRLRAYQAALQDFGLEADPRLIAYGQHIAEIGQAAMRQILTSGVKFTAVLASNDQSAIGAMEALREAGKRIPQDVAIIGFDDRPEAMAQRPPLTTVHSRTFERGYRALELMLQSLDGEPGTGAEVFNIPTVLVIRQSCGCPSSDILPVVSSHLPPSLAATDPVSVIARLAQKMTPLVLTETQRLGLNEAQRLCRELVEAFAASLKRGEAASFQLVLEETLWQVETVEDDVHVWQAALSCLRAELPVLIENLTEPAAPSTAPLRGAADAARAQRQLAEEMLDQARIVISGSVRRQYTRYLIEQTLVFDRVSPLTDALLTTLDEAQIYRVLAERLPEVGIHQAGVAFFEAEDDDPVAWSTLRLAPGPEDAPPLRFRTREFPPPAAYWQTEPYQLALLPLIIQGEQLGFVALDATHLELSGSIVRQLAAALNGARLYRQATEARQQAEEANQMKSRFLSMVSHELRTPLSLIVGLSDMLLHQQASAMLEDLKQIHTSAQHLGWLIRDVLDLASSEAGQLRLTYEPLDLGRTLQMVADTGRQLAFNKGLGWRSDLPETGPWVRGDRTRLQQVALNLVSNAVKFTGRGEVALRLEVKDKVATITVTDTGLGIPTEEQRLIFEEFRQSRRTTTRGYGGLGLGLAICRRLVKMHGGQIGVRSSGEEGSGSTFYFTLPVIEPPHLLSTPPDLPSLKEQAVVLLTNHTGSGERLSTHLVQHGFEVHILRLGENADWLSQLQKSPPGAVVLDMGLAPQQGWEVLRILKGNPATQDIPVLFYSLTQAQDGGSMLELDYLTKPVGMGDLAQALERQGLNDADDKSEKVILIVDDDPDILEMHTRIVKAQSATHRVIKARDGREALEILQQERPDLVLLDLMMPEVDGFGVLETMRAKETTRHIPVIVLTGQMLTEKDMARLNRGVAMVLEKGMFSVDETLAHVEAALDRKPKLGSKTQRLVRKAMAYIHEHYTEAIPREDLARHVGMDDDYLTFCFHKEMGMTPIAYLNRYRVNQAKGLLAQGELSITEVALAVGFSDSGYFTRVFRREVGTSPGAYRRNSHKVLSPKS